MAIITSTAAGNWNAGATWVGGFAPVAGDSAVVVHAVSVNVNSTVGTYGAAGTDAVQIGAAGALTINSGIALTVRGCVTATAAGRTLTISSGGSLIFDSSGAAGTPVYELRTNFNGFKLVTSGISGSRCALDKAAGSGNWSFHSNSTTDTAVDMAYTDVRNCRNSADTLSFNVAPAAGAGRGIAISNCIFDTTARVDIFGDAAANWSFTNVTWVNTVGLYSIRPRVSANATGTRVWNGCVFDKDFFSDTNSHNFDLQNNQFHGQLTLTGGSVLAGWSGNFVAPGTVNAAINTVLKGTYFDSYVLMNSVNPHYWNLGNSGVTGVATVDGFIFENLSADDQGDAVLADTAYTVATTIRAIRCIVLPGPTGLSSGSPITVARSADNLTVSQEFCTYHHGGINGESKGAQLFEQGTSNAYGLLGLVEYFRSNISWDTSSGRGWKVRGTSTNITSVSGTSTGANTSTTLNNTGLSMPVNRFSTGYSIFILSGTGSGQARDISSNTATEFTVASAWSVTPDATSVYRIYVLDIFTEAPNYNGGWNHSEGDCRDANYTLIGGGGNGRGYSAMAISSGTLYGANDASGTPAFADSNRDIAAWDLALGGAGTAANAIVELKKRNDPSGYNNVYNVPALLTYIRDGFKPTTPSYVSGSHLGTTIGAVQVTDQTVHQAIYRGRELR